MHLLTILVLLFSVTFQTKAQDDLYDALSGVQQLMTGETEYDSRFYDKFVNCLNQIDPLLQQSVTAQWVGFKTFAAEGGIPETDPWMPCPVTRWFEVNCTVQEYGNIPIWEPCNYASNLAYYHTTTEICHRQDWNLPERAVQAIAKTYASLGLGSAFMHGSNTNLGGYADTKLNDMMAFLSYQEAVANLAPSDNSLIHDLSVTPRAKNASELVDELMRVYIEVPVADWSPILENLDVPDIFNGMCSYFITVMSFMFEDDQVDAIASALLNLFGADSDITDFCLNTYLPEARTHVTPLKTFTDPAATDRLFSNTIGTVLKLMYAFLWQEQYVTSSDIWLKPEVNELGAKLLPLFNTAVQEKFLDYEHSIGFNLGTDYFPGQGWCDAWNPHSKWHLQTSIAMADFVFNGDELYQYINNAIANQTSSGM